MKYSNLKRQKACYAFPPELNRLHEKCRPVKAALHDDPDIGQDLVVMS